MEIQFFVVRCLKRQEHNSPARKQSWHLVVSTHNIPVPNRPRLLGAVRVTV